MPSLITPEDMEWIKKNIHPTVIESELEKLRREQGGRGYELPLQERVYVPTREPTRERPVERNPWVEIDTNKDISRDYNVW